MSRLVYLRFVTYAVIVVAYLLPRTRTVLPVTLSNGPMAPPMSIDVPLDSATHEPDFESTRLSGSEVYRLATAQVRRRGIDLNHFGRGVITLLHSSSGLNWMVAWLEKEPRKHVGSLGVIVVDATGETIDLPGFDRLEVPNQTPEPTTTLVTPRADARVAPSAVVAHL